MITKKQTGFTIVELLIVIVIIGILAAITVVAYSNIQQRANNSKIASDLAQIQKAIITARSNKESPLFAIYPNGAPEGSCIAKASGTDLAALPKTDTCWTGYLNLPSRMPRTSTSIILSILGGAHITSILTKTKTRRPTFA